MLAVLYTTGCSAACECPQHPLVVIPKNEPQRERVNGFPRASDEVTPEQRPEWAGVWNCEEGGSSVWENGPKHEGPEAGVEKLEEARVTG